MEITPHILLRYREGQEVLHLSILAEAILYYLF
jgi:hypothetical protein